MAAQRKPLIAGNWKMNLSLAEASALFEQVGVLAEKAQARSDVWVAPTALQLGALLKAPHPAALHIGAQDAFWEPSGAYTGAVSAVQLKEAGARFTLVGHSERRAIFGDDFETVRKKLQAAMVAGLDVVLCVGEEKEDREAGRSEAVVVQQLDAALEGLGEVLSAEPELVIAYEPVWAIGTGLTATPEDAQSMHATIRSRLGQLVESADATRILYGGSVKPGNASELLSQTDIDGALVGGASLKAEDFAAIIEEA